MFAAVKITNSKEKKRHLVSKEQIKITPVSYRGKPLYYLVEIKVHNGKIRWDLLESCCISYRNRLLLPSECSIPESIRLGAYKNRSSEIILMYNTMLRYMKNQSSNGSEHSLCLFDEDAIIGEKITRAAPIFSKINIVTNKPWCYTEISEHVMQNSGLCLSFASRPVYNDEKAVLVCRNPEHIPLNFKGTVFSVGNIPAPDCTAVKGDKILLDRELSEIIPPDVNPMHFLSAVYEFCDRQILWDLAFTS